MSTTIPGTMRAVVLTGHGGPEMLELQTDWPVPRPSKDEVLIQVAACGMNNTDINTRAGWYSKAVSSATTGAGYDTMNEEDPSWGGAPLSFPRIQGADVCGVVAAVGKNVEPSLIGKRVLTDNWLRDWNDPLNPYSTGYFGSEKNGGFAEFTVIDHRNIGVVSSELSDAELATFSCSYTTAEGMLSRANVTEQDTVLVTGASGGVGSALIQLAKRRGATVVGMASEEKHDALKSLGADALLSRNCPNLVDALECAIGRSTVSVVADIVGGEMFPALVDIIARGGYYTCSGAIAGPNVNLDLRTFYLRDLTFTGSTFIPPTVFKDVIGYIEREEIKPMVAATYPLESIHKAQEAFVQKAFVGNLVITL